MSKQPLVKPTRRPWARQRSASAAACSSVTTLASAGPRWAASSASISSDGVTTAVPTLVTATPDASTAKATASPISALAASARPRAARPVSPAPDTSNTRRGTPRTCSTGLPRSASDMPLAPRVTRMALAAQAFSTAASAASTSSSVSVGRPVMTDSSRALGLIRSAAPYFSKLRALASTISLAPWVLAARRQASITAGVTAPLA